VILQQPIAREQMTKLLASGATDLLEGFVSNKTRRKFKARLAWDAKEGKVVFAFEPRPGAAAGEAGRPAQRRRSPSLAKKAAAEGARRKSPRRRRAGEEGAAKRVAAKKPTARKGRSEEERLSGESGTPSDRRGDEMNSLSSLRFAKAPPSSAWPA
jgi:DNA topoisomerase-3